MATSAWQIAAGLAATAAVYPITRKWDDYVDRKRKYSHIDEGVADLGNPFKIRRKVMRRRFRRAKRGRRGFKRRRFGKRRFARRVKRVVLRTIEPRYAVATEAISTLAEANVGGRVTYVISPPAVLTGGADEDQMTGNKIWLKGMIWRGQIAMDNTTPTANGVWVRVTAVSTKDQGTGFFNMQTFGSTTTINTNPAQTSPDINPRFFQSTTAPNQHVGLGNVLPFDLTNVNVHKSWNFFINPGADTIASETSIPTLFRCYLPIHKMLQAEDPNQVTLTGSRRWKHKAYYFIMQVFATANGTNTDTVATMHHRAAVYYRDV